MTSPFWRVEDNPSPIEFVTCDEHEADDLPDTRLPEDWRDHVVVDTLHDGDLIPGELARSSRLAPLMNDGTLYKDFCRVRDWGADLVASELALALGLRGHMRVTVARVAMDFNRFPGSSAPDTPATRRFAISGAFAEVLRHTAKRHLIETYYDAVSARMEEAIGGARIKLAIHTYDEHNLTRTRRPEVSLLSRSESYQLDSRLPAGIFDPLFPDQLAESSCNRLLRDRVALVLQKAGFYVEHNYPYLLPDGSLEIRCQPWFFFRFLKRIFDAEHPDRVDHPPLQLVWSMLLNTNLRHPASAALAGYLHRFQRAPEGREAHFDEARKAYEEISRFLQRHPELVAEYRHSPARVSALTIEVRKDLVWEFDDDGLPLGPKPEKARKVARGIASALRTFAVEDWEYQTSARD